MFTSSASCLCFHAGRHISGDQFPYKFHLHYIAKSIGTPIASLLF